MEQFLTRLPNGLGKRKNSTTSEANKKLLSSLEKKESSKGMQMFIDFGQKSFGKTKTCLKCNMLLVLSDPEDVKRHDKFCGEVELEH